MIVGAIVASAQTTRPTRYPGYSTDGTQRQREIERRIIESADAKRVGQFARALAARPHIAGTPAQAATRDYVIEQMKSWGLETSIATYDVYLPRTTETRLERTQPSPKSFTLREPPLVDDPYSQHQLPFTFQHGYAAAGEVAAPLVYVNYATDADLGRLAELGVSLEGRIAIARYGHGYRGNKVRNVAARGAIGCLIYTDPHDDGYYRGDVYPVGPMRPADGVQHGSVKLGPPGDPTTPGWPSLPDAERIAPADSENLNRIPSMPISAAIARELLADLGGPEVPQEWQGALPFRYHVGPGPTAVRMKVARDEKRREIFNTFGRIEGEEFPDDDPLVGK
ncbi:MAG: folate hydrolase, partial [Planctomycetota bacterium]